MVYHDHNNFSHASCTTSFDFSPINAGVARALNVNIAEGLPNSSGANDSTHQNRVEKYHLSIHSKYVYLYFLFVIFTNSMTLMNIWSKYLATCPSRIIF